MPSNGASPQLCRIFTTEIHRGEIRRGLRVARGLTQYPSTYTLNCCGASKSAAPPPILPREWFEHEYANLTAASRRAAEAGLYALAWQLPAALNGRKALDIAHRVGYPRQQAEALDGLGRSLHHAGNAQGAEEHWWQALEIFERLGDPRADDVRERLQS